MSAPLTDAEIIALARAVLDARERLRTARLIYRNSEEALKARQAMHDAAEELADACDATFVLALVERAQRAEKALWEIHNEITRVREEGDCDVRLAIAMCKDALAKVSP